MSANNNYTSASAAAPLGGGTEHQEQQRAHWEEDGAGWGNFLVELNDARDKAPDKRTLQHLQDVLRAVRDNLGQRSLNHITAGCVDRARTSSETDVVRMTDADSRSATIGSLLLPGVKKEERYFTTMNVVTHRLNALFYQAMRGATVVQDPCSNCTESANKKFSTCRQLKNGDGNLVHNGACVNCVHGGKGKMNSCSLVLVKLEFPDGFSDDEYDGPDESPFLDVSDDDNDGRGYVPIAEYAARQAARRGE